MIDYSIPGTIMDASREELIEIFQWVRAREMDNPITVLVGGWAVYCYNQRREDPDRFRIAGGYLQV